MRILFALLFTVCSLSAFDAKAQETGGKNNWVAAGRQVIDYLVDKHVDYNVIYDARDFGLPTPDSLHLKTADGFGIFAYEICPEQPKGVVICLSGIENPSVTAFYGHAAEFYKADVATIMPDLRGHGKSDGNRICLAYEETRDVKAVTDYIKSNVKYKGVPVIVMGVSMGGAVSIRSIGENKDIGSRLLKEHRKKLNSVGYGIWENVIEETLVRASVIRYLIDHGYSEETIREEINNQHEYYGFTWLPKDIEWYKGDVLEISDKM